MRVRNELIGVSISIFLAISLGVPARFSQSKSAKRQPARQKENRPPRIVVFTSSSYALDLCPSAPGGTCFQNKTFVLEVTAHDPDGDPLSYKYSATVGRIAGESSLVTWNLEDVPLGTYRATVEVSDGRGGKASESVSIIVQDCGKCDAGCPVVVVTCEDNANEGQLADFTVTVSATDPEVNLRYMWTVANGEIMKGQGSKTITARVLGPPGDLITATVRVGGLDPACTFEASCVSRIQKRTP